jgi:shikimate dehydrogenase
MWLDQIAKEPSLALTAYCLPLIAYRMSKIFGIIGNPLAHNLTPILMNAALSHMNIDADFKKFELDLKDPESLANFCYETDLNEIGGFAVASPFREDIMAYMDHYDPLAKIIGTYNTVINEESKLIGHNTESIGALQALQEKTEIPGKRILVIGAGAVGRGFVYSLKEFEAEVFVLDRDAEKAEGLAQEFDVNAIEPKDIEQEQFDIIINATPCGSLPNRNHPTLGLRMASPLSQDQIPSHSVVMDLVLNPIRTKLIEEAEEVGAQVVSGERTFLFSTLRQFELFFGVECPLEVMEEAMYDALEKQS